MYEESARRLAEKFGVSQDRAHAALLLAQGDILDAALLLERESPDQSEKVSSWSTATGGEIPAHPVSAPRPRGWDRVWEIVKGIVLHPANRLEVRYPGGGGLSVPLLILALMLLVAFWITTLLLGLGWVLGCRFALRGPEVEIPQANQALTWACDQMQAWRKRLGL